MDPLSLRANASAPINADHLSSKRSYWNAYRFSGLKPVFAQSQRGNPVIMIGHYRFNRVNKYGNRTRWVCVKAKAGCRASLHTLDNAIVRVWGFHDPLAHTSANRFWTTPAWVLFVTALSVTINPACMHMVTHLCIYDMGNLGHLLVNSSLIGYKRISLKMKHVNTIRFLLQSKYYKFCKFEIGRRMIEVE